MEKKLSGLLILMMGIMAGLLLIGCPTPSTSDSTNANLSALTLDSGTLSPAFAAATTEYTVTVGNTITSVTVIGTKADDKASVTPAVTLSNLAVDVAQTAIITVTAESGATKAYTVAVTRMASTSPEITSFTSAVTTVSGDINGEQDSISLEVPYGTSVTALVPTITFTGASISPASGAAQNFTLPVVYTVTAIDGTTKAYTVTVTPPKVGVILPAIEQIRWTGSASQFASYCADTHHLTHVLYSAYNTTIEGNNVDTLIAEGIKVLIIHPQDGSAATAAVTRAKEAGISVISYCNLVTGTANVDYYVGFDNIDVGRIQGQYLKDAVTGTGNPLYLYAGHSDDDNAFIFFQGAWEILQPKIADGTFVIQNSAAATALKNTNSLNHTQQESIITQITTNWDTTITKDLVTANLAVSGVVKGNVYILAPNDNTAWGMVESFTADAGITGYTITGQDATKESVQAIIDGTQNMTILKDLRTLLHDTVNMADALLEGKIPTTNSSYNNGVINVPSKKVEIITITRSNIQSALIDSGYHQASDFTGL